MWHKSPFSLPGRHIIYLALGILITGCTTTPAFMPKPTLSPTDAPSSYSPTAPTTDSTGSSLQIPCDTAAFIQAVANTSTASSATTLSLEANCVYTLTATYKPALPRRSGLPLITGVVIINGNGAVVERDAAAPNFRLFDIASGGSLTLNDLTLRNGRAVGALGHIGAGGAIYTEGALVLQRVTLTANTAEGGFGISGGPVTELPGYPALGGAIFVVGGTVHIANSTFSNNVALGGSAAEYVCSESAPDDCRYTSVERGAESLELSQLGSFGIGGKGGESSNRTLVPGLPGGYGGGRGGAGNQSETINISGVPHLSGGPGGGGGGGGFGGGLFVDGGSVVITDSTFTGNTTVGGLGGIGVGSGCCHSPAGEPGLGMGTDIFWRSGTIDLIGTPAVLHQGQ